MSECTHNCNTCGSSCSVKDSKDQSLLASLNPKSSVKHLYAVVSGKGGVGKSLVTSMLAVKAMSKGYRTAILDADITGPSIPRAFGIDTKVGVTEDNLMLPAVSNTGIEIMSTNLLLDNDTDPVIWRGPIIAGVVKQFWTDALWDNVDYMFVDMPPGTGDVPLTVFQSLPVDGIIIVTSPQELVEMIVEKAVNMAQKMDIKIMGVVENMSYYQCPDCGKQHHIFGESHIDEIAAAHGFPVLAKVPIDPAVAAAVDRGAIETVDMGCMDEAAKILGM